MNFLYFSSFRKIKYGSRTINVVLATIIIFCYSLFNPLSAQYPAGFSQVLVANGISNPTVMAFSPDGRIFVAQQNGVLRIIKNNVLLGTPFISLSVNSSGERGLIGITFDPNFASNQYVYLYYTVSSGSNNRISRFTANGDVALAGSEVVILNLDPLSGATNHNGGTMEFGPDGKLYVGIGENANTSFSQNLDTYHGKVIRINADGTIPVGNPYPTGTLQRRSLWSTGLRNPYTLNFQPGTGKLFVNDVGQSTWEEINDATNPGLNFGWPATEGATSNPLYTSPVYAYQHGGGLNRGCAITGGAFFNPSSTNYPSQYIGLYFYIDFCNNWIDQLTFNGSTATRSNFAANIAGSPVGIVTGTDGNIYFLSRSNNAVYKIIYTTSTSPTITAQPQSISVSQGSTATFSITATGTATLAYQWRKNNVDISGANAASFSISNTSTADNGNYSVFVSNGSGNATSNNAVLSVTTANTAPNASIFLPGTGNTYAGSDVVIYEGSGFDVEDGNLPPSAYTWNVKFFHDQHNHPGPIIASGVSSGTFTIPNSGETATNVFYRIYLTVTDSQGASNSDSVDVAPRLSNLNFATNPTGLRILLDGQPVLTPTSIASVEGIIRTIGVEPQQTVSNGLTYNFLSWSNAGAQSQTFATPMADLNLTANFTPVYRNADNPTSTAIGLDYQYYTGSYNALPNFTTLTPALSGTIAQPLLTPATQADNFAFEYKGFVQVPTDDVYTFYTSSDDGSKLFIGSTLVVDNDGLHGLQERNGRIALRAGKHAITIQFFEKAGDANLITSYSSVGIAKQIIPAAAYFRAVTVIPPSSVTLNANADAHVRSGSYKFINYGNATIAETRTADTLGSLHREYFVKFPLTGVSSTISTAVLKLYGGMKLTNVSTSFTAKAANNNWTESTIRFTNRPANAGAALSNTTITGKTLQYYNWNVVALVQAALNAGATEITFVIRSTNAISDFAVFNTKENANNKPLLVIETGTNLTAPVSTKFIENNLADEKIITLFPNPSSDGFYIKGIDLETNATVEIYDLSGRRMSTEQLSSNSDYVAIPELISGSYLVRIIQNGKYATHKLLVIKE